MNEITLRGTAWRPEVKASQSGMLILSFGLGLYQGKDKDGKAQYFTMPVKAFKEVAESAGDAIREKDNVVVTGRLQQETWNDKETGKKQYKIIMIADVIAKDCKQFKSDAAAAFNGQDMPDEEIPF